MPERQQTQILQQTLDLALQHLRAGRLPQAKTIYQQILQSDPNHPVALHLLGVIAQQGGKDNIAVDLITKALAIKPDYAEAHSNLGVALHRLNRLEEAVASYGRALEIKPNSPEPHNNLGNTLQDLGRFEEAVAAHRKALALKPDYAKAHNNLGNAFRNLGAMKEAINSYQKTLRLKPDYVEAHSNLGVAFQELGELEGAIASYHKAIDLKPDYVEAHTNLGVALQAFGELEEAIASYHKVLILKPEFAAAHYNLGIALQELGTLDDAANSYRKALAIRPDYADAHNNLGVVLEKLGKPEEAAASYFKAIDINPTLDGAWNNLKFIAKALQFSEGQKGRKGNIYLKGLSESARATVDFAMLEYYLDKFKPDKSEQNAKKAMAALPAKSSEEVFTNGGDKVSGISPKLPEKLVALLHFGRSGTGLLHSLIDGHPEVSTLPSIYLRGFFNAGVWRKLSANGWRGLPERFADEFAVLFDANSSKPTAGMPREDSSFLGRKEGMTRVGENRDESLSLDRDQFCSEALHLMSHYEKIDPKLFLLIVHAVFEKVTGTKTEKHTTFYHLHGPTDFAGLNFLRYTPDARLIMMVREPVQSCESWSRICFKDNNYSRIAYRVVQMLFALDQIAFRIRDSVGVRLEDLKMEPEATLRSLCTWLGIKETPSLYQMTAQGKKWWGDPTSPDYDANKAMDPFDTASIKRPVGTVFSEKDRFVLGTLFYPFSVRFGYREPDPVAFEKDLKEVRPLFDELLDFETVMSERSNIDPAQFKRSGAYLLLRASFMDRWEVLNQFKEYPHPLSPLKIALD